MPAGGRFLISLTKAPVCTKPQKVCNPKKAISTPAITNKARNTACEFVGSGVLKTTAPSDTSAPKAIPQKATEKTGEVVRKDSIS